MRLTVGNIERAWNTSNWCQRWDILQSVGLNQRVNRIDNRTFSELPMSFQRDVIVTLDAINRRQK